MPPAVGRGPVSTYQQHSTTWTSCSQAPGSANFRSVAVCKIYLTNRYRPELYLDGCVLIKIILGPFRYR
ncbi:unnamed protein product, partial [Staurois parvus]